MRNLNQKQTTKKSVHLMKLCLIILGLFLSTQSSIASSRTSFSTNDVQITEPSRAVIRRLIGNKSDNIQLKIIPAENGHDTFTIESIDSVLTVEGNSPVAISHGFYTYLKKACKGMVSWGRNNIQNTDKWPDYKWTKLLRLTFTGTF